MLERMSRHWWTLALRGALAILFGLCALFVPGSTVLTLVTFFGIYAFVDGAFAIFSAVRFRHEEHRWGGLLWEGVIGLLFGILAWVHPFSLAVAVVYVVAGWAVVTGIVEIAAAIALRRVIAGEWALALMGVVSLVLGVFLFAAPGAGLVAWSWALGLYALVAGIALVALAFRVRRHGQSSDGRLIGHGV